jgi:D-lactate dehydrogenase (cytochrome)
MERAFTELQALLGDRFSTGQSVREHHGKDESWHAPKPPDGVCFPRSTDEVAAIVKICARHQVPVIPFGAGTSLEGHVHALEGGVTIDMSQMTRILAVNTDDLDATVEAGVSRKTLNHHLRDQGLFFPVDPGADATLGGMAATRASGTNAVRYGTMRENVLSLTVVLSDGKVIRTSRRARKSAAGYDLTRIFVGSEGTLGIITEVTVRLYGIPEAISAAVVGFPDIESAVNAVILTIQTGVPVARIELLDEVQMEAVNRYSKLDYEVRPTLFLEFHGSRDSVKAQALEVGSGCGKLGTNPIMPPWHFGPVAKDLRPTSACPFPAWPSVSSRPKKISKKASSPLRWSVTWVTAISIWWSCSIPTTPTSFKTRNGSTKGSLLERLRWTEPVRENTVWDSERASFSETSTETAWR